jgi:hypothetical protein
MPQGELIMVLVVLVAVPVASGPSSPVSVWYILTLTVSKWLELHSAK